MNNPESCLLTHNRFNTYMVLIFTDLKKAQIYKMPHRNSHHQEIGLVIKFDYQPLFKPFDLDKETHARIETDANFLFKIEVKKYIYVGDKVFSFETVDDIGEYFSETGHNDVKYPFAPSDGNIYYMLYQKYITIEECDKSGMRDEYEYLHKKDSELKGDIVEDDGIVEYGSDFLNCKIIHSKKKYTLTHIHSQFLIIVIIFNLIVITVEILFI